MTHSTTDYSHPGDTSERQLVQKDGQVADLPSLLGYREFLELSSDFDMEGEPAPSTPASILYRRAVRRLAALPPDTSYEDVVSALQEANEAYWQLSEVCAGRKPVNKLAARVSGLKVVRASRTKAKAVAASCGS